MFRLSCLMGLSFWLGCSAAPPAPVEIATEPVTLEIQSGGKTQTILIDGLPLGCTVEDVMRSAADEGSLNVEISGSGTTAFLASIDGREGTGTEGWLFKVDGDFSERGIGTTELDPPATVTWIYDDMSAAMQ